MNNIKHPSFKYTKAVIICHGKSELILVQSIKSNLRLSIELDSKNNGENSIQITSLINFLNRKGYKDVNSLIRKFPYIDRNKRKLINFKLFIIMDVDEPELTKEIIEKYKNKSMFKSFDYYDYIVPIYNDKNLDDVLIKLGYKIETNNKTKSYRNIFPGKNGDYESFKRFKEVIKMSRNSNLILLLEYLDECINN